MIAFFDTSALVKLFVNEADCELSREWARRASLVVVSQLAWVEFHAAMALKRRTLQLASAEIDVARSEFGQIWPRYQRAGIDAQLCANAADLAWRHDLRAYDSVQLASALRAHASTGGYLRFCSFDKALLRAAQAEGVTAPGA